MIPYFHSNKILVLITLPLLLAVITVVAFGSRLLIHPTQLKISPCGEVIMFRDYPLARWLGVDYPLVSYVVTVTGMTPGTNHGYPCFESNKWRYNQDLGRGFNVWPINHYAEPCMKDPLGFVWTSSMTGYLFDFIPLRPVTISATVFESGTPWDHCPFRAGLGE
jgi:hypothetical protein